MKVVKSTIPAGSIAETYLPVGYSDVFTIETNSPCKISPDDVMVNFWLDFPWWVEILFKLRNFLVQFVGLKGSENSLTPVEFEQLIREGKDLGFTSVPAKSENETILLLKDKHLDAYISVHIQNLSNSQRISATTLVNFHQKLGHLYFFFIKPFHKVIVKKILKRSITNVIQSYKDKL